MSRGLGVVYKRQGQAFGTMLLGLPGDPAEAAKAIAYIKNQPNVTMEEVRDYHG